MMPLTAASLFAGAFSLAHMSPDAAVLVATLGLGLITVELNRPGLVVPGAAGILLILFAMASLIPALLNPGAVAVLGLAFVTVLLNVWYRLPVWLLAAATLALIVALRLLVVPRGETPVSWPVAAGCGLAVGVAGSWLSRAALRARRAKAVH